jgi:hypothetical protein
MKKLFVSLVFLVSSAAFYSEAQVSWNINIGNQPVWGPTGYDHVEYYYLPDIDMYYNVPAGQYIYLEGNRWISSQYLPYRYRDYDLYHGYKVVINEPRPYLRHEEYRERYSSYRGRRDQENFRDRRPTYANINERRDNDRWRNDRDDKGRGDRDDRMRGEQNNRGRDNDRGNGRDKGRNNDKGDHDRGRH